MQIRRDCCGSDQSTVWISSTWVYRHYCQEQGRLQGRGKWTQLASKLGLGGKRITPWRGEEFIQFLFTKSETLDSCHFETKMHQILFQFQFFSAVTPRTPATGALPPYPRGGEGREGKGQGEGKGRGGKGEGGGSLHHFRWGIDAPGHELTLSLSMFVCAAFFCLIITQTFLHGAPWLCNARRNSSSHPSKKSRGLTIASGPAPRRRVCMT